MAIFYPTAEVVRAGKNKPAQAQMSCIVALNKEMTTHFGSRRCTSNFLFRDPSSPLIETKKIRRSEEIMRQRDKETKIQRDEETKRRRQERKKENI